MKILPVLFSSTVLPVLLLSTPQVAFAQEEDDSLMLEEIIVTAQRREESLQDVPISISAFTGEQLVKTNITNAAQYLVQTPNVGFSEDGEGGYSCEGSGCTGSGSDY